jgi:putative molybdopterin biosynthesis protein
VPLAEEDYFLVCLRNALDSPPVLKLREVLASATWQQTLQGLPGYGGEGAGAVLPLTQALPWWKFRVRKRKGVMR